MSAVPVNGIVFSGEGLGSYFVAIASVKKQIIEKLGFTPYPGTLNIRLSENEARMLKRVLSSSTGVEIVPSKGFLRAHCFEALIVNSIKGAIVVPDKESYPTNVLEFIAPVFLRGALTLRDGDEVEIRIFHDSRVKASCGIF